MKQQNLLADDPRWLGGLLSACLLLGAISSARAENIYQTGFESHDGFTIGPIDGQKGWGGDGDIVAVKGAAGHNVFHLDGSVDYVAANVPVGFPIHRREATISVRFLRSAVNAQAGIAIGGDTGFLAQVATSGGECYLGNSNSNTSPQSFAAGVWHELVVKASAGARADGANVPATDVTNELRNYPKDLISSPLDVREARFTLTPGSGPGTVDVNASGAAKPAAKRGLLSGLAERDLSVGVVLVALLLAMGWGALHALSPGHGKSMVAAYLVGSRGTARHAFILGAFVTATHIITVIALGLVTLWASELILPETVFAWVNLLAALFVVCIGLWVVWLRLRSWRAQRESHLVHDHDHGHSHDHDHHHHDDHAHDHRHDDHADDGRHSHDHADHDHDHGDDDGHSHAPPADLSIRALAAAGVSAGLLPCPSAMVLMLGAISLGRTAYGLVLVVAFSLGLAIVLSSIGLLFLYARRFMDRLPLGGRIANAIPVVSAVVIVGLGLMLTVRAVPALM